MEDPVLSSSADDSDLSSQSQQNVDGDGNQAIVEMKGGTAFNKVDGNVSIHNNYLIGQLAMPTSTEYSKTQATTSRINSLENDTIELFLKEANDPNTLLYDKLREINYTDGRNSKGIFPEILTAQDIQIVLIDGQNRFGRYCSPIENNHEHQKCSTEITETYLILIPSKMGVHKAVIYQPFLFTVQILKKIEWYMDERLKKYNHIESIEIDEPNQVFANELSKKLQTVNRHN